MFSWLKKKLCTHYKTAGAKYPDNMETIFRFSPYTKDAIGYGIHECKSCGVRAFSSCGYHMMYNDQVNLVDDFINRKITNEQFINKAKTLFKWVKVA